MYQLRRLMTVAGFLAALAGPVAAQQVNEVLVSPENLALRVGERRALIPAAYDRIGNVVPTARFTYRSTNPAIAAVDAEGSVTGRGPGSATIEVISGTRRATVAVTVTGAAGGGSPAGGGVIPGNISRVVIVPATVYLVPSESQRLEARALAADGSVIGPVQAMWRSLTPGSLSVDSITGNVIGLGAGTGTIEARLANGLSATAPVQVNAVPFEITRKTLSLAPDELDSIRIVVPAQSGRRLEAGLTFVSSNPNIVQVGPTGLMQARSAGQVQIVVTGYFQEDRVLVTVHRPVAALSVDPAPSAGPVTAPIRGFQVVRGRAVASDSAHIPEAQLRWEVADSSVASYDPATGRVTGKRQGTTTLMLSTRGHQPKTWTINVVPAVVSLAHERLGMRTRDTLTVGARIRDEADTDFGAAPDLEWTSTRPEVVRVDNAGRLEAVAPGRTSIVASAAWGRPDTLEVIVTGNLLLTSDRRLRGTPGIYQINLARPDSLIPLMTDTRRLLSPALSPDRRRIAYSATADGRNFDLWVADADGRNPRALTNDSIPETEPSWSPDGTKIVFTTSTRREREQFGVINADGTGRRMLTVPPGTSQNPVFSPDGRYIAFLGLRNRDIDVFVMDQNATGAAALRNVTNNEDKERQVRYAANGDLIVLVEMERNRGYQIVKYAAGTNTRSVLATAAYEIVSFGVSRDGSTLAYVTTEPVENVRGQRTKTVLYLQPTAAGSTATAVRTPVAETVGFPSF
jgi:uncharacterized protein YjdB